MSATETPIIVFARAPEPGRVKTRLIPLLGDEGAASFQQAMIERTLVTARQAAIGRIGLWCAPSAQHPLFEQYRQTDAVVCATQCDGDLGARMLDAVSAVLAAAPRVIIVGTDCPALTPSHIQAAAAALESHDAVLIPAEDGGYVLLGLKKYDVQLFSEIEWGGDRVLAATRERLAALGWSWEELSALWDVDRPADFTRLVESGLMPEVEGLAATQCDCK